MPRARMFPGLLSFGSDDASIFFGRETESIALLSHIEKDPVVVVTGLSGCGKSSLIKAGVIPKLQGTGRLVIYASVIENIINDVLFEIKRASGADNVPADYVDALQQLYAKGPGIARGVEGAAHGYDLAAVRALITSAFTDKQLLRFCQNRPAFRPILTQVYSASSLEDIASVLIEHCQTHILFTELIAEIEKDNPRQYQRYHKDLVAGGCRSESELQNDGVNPPTRPNQQWRPGQPVVLIVDQFEQALRTSHSVDALKTFVQGISRLLSQARPVATVVIVLRADWLYFLETSVREFYPGLNVYSVVFTVDPLTKESAHRAICGPLETNDIPHNIEIVSEIVSCLERSSVGPAVASSIQPIQLQMVVRALVDSAEKSGQIAQAFTVENYQQSGGVESILRNYLVNSLGKSSEAWRLLARFIAQDEKTGRTIRRSELLSVPAAGNVEAELGFLTSQGFLEAYEAESTGDCYYRLAHDYLVEAIADYLRKNPDQQGWKLAEEWLANGTREWHDSTHPGNGDGLLLERNRYLHIYQYRDKLKLSREARDLLVLTALRYGHEGLGYWLSRDREREPCMETVAARLLSPDPEVQQSARQALNLSLHPKDSQVSLVGNEEQKCLQAILTKTFNSTRDPEQRLAAARALWLLRALGTTRQQVRVGATVFGRLVRANSLRIASYSLTALVVLGVFAGLLYARERMRGAWEIHDSLKAGPTTLVVASPLAPEKLYAVTRGGPGPREGNSLFVRQGGQWLLRSREFSQGIHTSMIVTYKDGTPWIYATLYGEGILRSKDDGQTWELINRGLPSHGLTSIAVDPDNPDTLYVATNDWRGILRSVNGGDSWDYFDYHGDIYGTIILTLGFSKSSGALIAGTEDGSILRHGRDDSNWELVHGMSKGAVKVLTVAEADNDYIYAGTSRGIVIRSEDGGNRWTIAGQPSDGINSQFNIVALDVAPNDPKHIFVSAYGNGGYTIWESQDMGFTWRMLPGIGLPRTWPGSLLAIGQSSQTLVVGSQDGLFISQDGGNTWDKQALDAPLAHIADLAMSEHHRAPVYVALQGSVYTNMDGDLQDWLHGKGLQAEIVRSVVVDPDEPQTAYAGVLLSGQWSVFVTHDGGQTWRLTSAPDIEPAVPDTMALALAKSAEGTTYLYAGTLGCGLFRSTDKGNSWDTFGRAKCNEDVGGNMPPDISLLAVDAYNLDLIYAAAGQELFRSTTGGTSWQRLEPGVDSTIRAVFVDPSNTDTVYLVASSGGFWRSDDAGTSWQQLGEKWFAETTLSSGIALPDKHGHLVVGASTGEVWKSTDGGQSWISIRENLAVSSITSMTASTAIEDRLLVGTFHDGIAVYTPGRLLDDMD